MSGRVLLRAVALVAGLGLVGAVALRVAAQDEGVAADNGVTSVGDGGENAQIDVAESSATPMAQRVAVIGFLNKRNGVSRDFQMKPGDNFKVADGVIIRLRACDKTAPWELDPYTGAFVQLDVENAEHKYQRVFSGWLYKETPSINVVENPIYDVWVKDCQMNHGEPAEGDQKHPAGADATASAAHRSKAKKSAEPDGANDSPPDPAAPADGGGDTATDNKPQ